METKSLKLEPEICPEGLTPLHRAFLQFAIAVMGSASAVSPRHLGAAITFGKLGPQHLEFEKKPESFGHEEVPVTPADLAALFARPMCLSFGAAVRSGGLRAFYASKGVGDPTPMRPGAWQTDDPFLRFRGWSYDPNNEGASGVKLPCWVYVDTDDLKSVCAEMGAWRQSLPKYNGEELPDFGEEYLFGYPVRLMPCDEKIFIWPPRLPVPGKLSAVESQPLAANDQAGPPPKQRRGNKSGPKPEPWAETLQSVFERQHDLVADMSQRQRHNHVLTFCTDRTGRPRSHRTTDDHWQKHLDRRAAQDSD